MVLLCLGVFGCANKPSTRILLIGNSFVAVNGGMDRQLRGLAPSAEIAQIAVSGNTLEQHWNDGNALQTIRQGGWNYVVLQEQSQTPIFNRAKFFEYANKFNGEVLKNKGKTILLMTWERPDSVRSGVTTDNLASAYTTVGSQLGVLVAPAGLAFQRSLRERSDLALFVQDGHPTISGMYLAACVLYATIFRASPVGNVYADANISPEDTDYLQRIAAETTGH